jgi:hypothetical protein
MIYPKLNNRIVNISNIDIMNYFYGGTKKPLRKIKDIISCEGITNKSFYIDVKTENKVKRIEYEVKNVNVRNEIVAKIKYLIVYSILT